MDNNLKIGFSEPLKEQDAESQTYGCRANNPNICKNNGVDEVCAFVRSDCICKIPSRAWKKKYNELKEIGCKNE